MITFDLQCAAGHTFEGWFDDAKAFEMQRKKNLINCPVCDDSNISKKFSPFAIKGSPSPRQPAMPSADELAKIGRKIAEYVDKNFDDVGCDFAKEALKIHYGVSQERNIKGTSTKEEEKVLKKEGIPFVKFPVATSNDADS
ncbi:MAG: DUF1178 family protein [Deltaproteobacteria bacterium]|nr:DUF1178 family protein [Deltaproteobacteria bacterium]